MDLTQSTDQDAIQQTLRSFLEKELPMERVRKVGGDGCAALAGIWRAAAELGFFGLGLSEENVGAGYGLTEEMILFEELGQCLAPGPWLGTVLAAHALAGEKALRDRLLAGELPVALLERGDGSFRNSGGRLSGTWASVPDAVGVGGFLVLDA